MRSPLHAPVLIAITIAAATALGGCALIPQGQSVAAACLELTDKLEAVGTGIAEGSSELASDPEGAAASIAEVAATFDTAANDIDNPEVHDAAVKASKSINEFSSLIGDYATDPDNVDVDALTGVSEDVSDDMTALQEVCSK